MSYINKPISFYIPIAKKDDDKRMVYGYASTECKDSDGEVIARDAVANALPDYMKFGNLRAMHQLIAAGKVKEADVDEKGLYIGAKVVDDDSWKKVKEGVYSGFSIGGAATERKGNTITGLNLIEISLVDRPANPECLVEVWKAAQVKEGGAMPKITADEARKRLTEAVQALNPEQVKAALAAFEKQVKPEDKGPPDNPVISPDLAEKLKERIREPEKQQEEPEQHFDLDHFALMYRKVEKVNSPGELCQVLGIPLNKLPEVIDRAAELSKAEKTTEDPTLPYGLKKEDVVTKGDDAEKPYGDVAYADPGYQEDGKKRYPIDTEAHIRAAWNYINKPKNSGQYSSKNLSSIKQRIVAAWKDKIDPDGPPSAKKAADILTRWESKYTLSKAEKVEALSSFGKADATISKANGMYSAGCALNLLCQLDYLCECLELEEAVEEDDSPLPGRFKQLLETMAALVKALVEEEIEEMLNDKDAADFQGAMNFLYAAKPEMRKAAAGMIRKAIGDNTAAPGFQFLDDFADALEKGGSNDSWEGHPKGSAGDSNDRWKAASETADKVHKAAQEIVEHAMKLKAAFGKSAKDDEDEEEEEAAKAKKGKYSPTEHGDPGAAPKNVRGKKKASHDDEDEEDAMKASHDDEDEEDAAKSKKGRKARMDDEEEIRGGKRKKAAPQATDEHDQHQYDDGSDDDGDEQNDGKTGNGAENYRAGKAAKSTAGAVADLASVVADLAKSVKDMQTDLYKSRRDPPAKGAFKVVEKAQDYVPSNQEEQLDPSKPTDVLKAIWMNPQVVSRNSR